MIEEVILWTLPSFHRPELGNLNDPELNGKARIVGCESGLPAPLYWPELLYNVLHSSNSKFIVSMLVEPMDLTAIEYHLQEASFPLELADISASGFIGSIPRLAGGLTTSI